MARAKSAGRAGAKSAARKRAKRTGIWSRLWRGLRWRLTGPLGLVLLIVGIVWYTSLDLADLRRPPDDARPQITLLDRAGEAFAGFGDRYGAYLRLDEMSPWLPKAVIAIEDRRFYHHPGIDPLGIMRALIRNLEAGRVVQGGSTISQQLAKLAFLTPERTISRKIKEALYTIWLETRFDKDQILEAYLNRLYLGGGAYGVDGAARHYFDKPASALTLAEAAMVAGLIRAPSRYAPTRDLELARQRAAVVLNSMVEADMISAEEAAQAKADPARLAKPSTRATTGYFADWVVVQSRLHADTAAQTRMVIRTTLDQRLQRAAGAAVNGILGQHGERRQVDQAALIAMTLDGRIRAMLGGRSYADSQFNRATQALRQPGSAFKLFVYLAALEAGIMPEQPVAAGPIRIDGWSPRNFDDAYPPQMAMIDAFAESVNTAAVRLSEQVGREQVIAMAERLGITSVLRDDPSLALGSSEVSLLELTAAYATVANGGRLVWPVGIEEVTGEDGVLYRRRPVDGRVLEPAVVRAMTVMLETAVSRGTGRQASLRRFVAGKTGTSSDYRDAWFVGFTDELVIGVWVGNDDGRPMRGVTGGGLPALIFRDFVLRAQGDAPFRPPPPPAKPTPGEIPVAVVRDALGDLIEGLGNSLERLFGG